MFANEKIYKRKKSKSSYFHKLTTSYITYRVQRKKRNKGEDRENIVS